MILIALILLFNTVSAKDEVGAKQLLQYLNEHKEPAGQLSTSYGYPVTSIEANLGINRDSNLLLNHYIYESMSSFSLERIPPRLVYANGCGAKGYFEVTHDVSKILNVKAFNTVGKKTQILARFSGAIGEIGSPEVNERGKGFAVKFYTEEGNLDVIGVQTNAFMAKNPVSSWNLVHALKANPRTNIHEQVMLWDYVVNHPESLHAVIQFFSTVGQPNSYRHIASYALHTYQVENDNGDVSFIKLNWFPDDGIHNFTNTEALTLIGTSPDYLTQELYDSISNETYPSWTLCMQAISKKDIEKMNVSESDLFDITMNWPEDKFPQQPIGKLVLNQHVNNHFAEVEQAAFNPGNLVPGIRGVDKIFETRIFLYRDTQIHRLGTGFNRITVNCPLNKPLTYNRDGNPPVGDNGGDAPNYYPNSFHGIEALDKKLSPLFRPKVTSEPTNFKQIDEFYNRLSKTDQEITVTNIGKSLATIPKNVRDKAFKIFENVDGNILNSVKAVIGK